MAQKKRVLITGCSSGFGFLTAIGAAKAGFEVVATMRKLEKARFLQEAAEQAGVELTIDRLDVTDRQSIEEVAAKYGPVDMLVNNAGILIMGSFLDITEEEMERVWQTNYFGIVHLTRAITPGMIDNGGGTIINVASLAGRVGHMYNAAYGASKHALVGFSQSIRFELKPFNINVVAIEPGYHRTEIIRTNANACENFYDRSSPTFEWNRGFLRTMMDEIIPRAGDPQAVADKIVQIMHMDNPKAEYALGRDARFVLATRWLGLSRWLEEKAWRYVRRNRRLENKREAEKQQKRRAARAARTEERP